MAKIHPTAIIEDGARLAETVTIGPWVHIGSEVTLEENVTICARASILGKTTLKADVFVHEGAVLGGVPQILNTKPEDSGTLVVGSRTVIREYVTLGVGSTAGAGETLIGEDCFLMGGCHFGHDCVLGDRNVIANNVAVGGHSVFGQDVWVGGQAALHQYSRVGDHAFIGGGAIIVADVPPFCSVTGNHAKLSGLNLVGLKRRGFERASMNKLRHAYKALFHGSDEFETRLDLVTEQYGDDKNVALLLSFIREGGRRALCHPE